MTSPESHHTVSLATSLLLKCRHEDQLTMFHDRDPAGSHFLSFFNDILLAYFNLNFPHIVPTQLACLPCCLSERPRYHRRRSSDQSQSDHRSPQWPQEADPGNAVKLFPTETFIPEMSPTADTAHRFTSKVSIHQSHHAFMSDLTRKGRILKRKSC